MTFARMALCVCFSENGPRPRTKKSLENIAGLWRRTSKRHTHPAAYRGRGPLKITDIHRVLDITLQVSDEYEDPLWLVRRDPPLASIGAGTDPLQVQRDQRWDQNRDLTWRQVRQEKRSYNLHPFDDAILSPLQRMTDGVATPLGEHRARLRPGPRAHLPIVRKSTVQAFASPSQRLQVESCPPLPSISHPRIDLRRASRRRN